MTIYGMLFSLSKPLLLAFIPCFIFPIIDLSVGGAFRKSAPGQLTLFVLQFTSRTQSKLFEPFDGEVHIPS